MVCGYCEVLRMLCWFWMLLFSFLLNYLSPSLLFLRQNKFLLIKSHHSSLLNSLHVVRFTRMLWKNKSLPVFIYSPFNYCLLLKVSLTGASEKKKSGVEPENIFFLLKININITNNKSLPMRGIISKHTILLLHTEGTWLLSHSIVRSRLL